MGKYYDGAKLLSLKDINGNNPEIYICTSNRSGGKTTYFNRLAVNRFLNYGEEFAVLYRFSYELTDIEDKFFKEIGSLFFHGRTMTSKRKAKGKYYNLYIDDELCGYALAINDADTVKKYSHMFSRVKRILFDEFQSETNHYCPNEVAKLISIHTSIARGGGKQVRYVPLYMISNPVSLINPYYVSLGISLRLRADTKFLRGNGFVMEQGFVENASIENLNSAFNQAFSGNNYIRYSAQAVYLNDNKAFVEKPSGKHKYLCTIKYEGKFYSIKEFSDSGFLYCDDRADTSFKTKITVTSEDHQINYVMLRQNDFFLQNLRWLFEKGCFRFKNVLCKEAILKMLTY